MPLTPSADEVPPERPPLRRRIATGLLLLAAGVGLALLLQSAPRERHLELRLDPPAGVTAVEVTWVDADGDPLRHSRQNFAAAAPEAIELPISLRDGDYSLLVRVLRGSSYSDSSHRIRFDDEVDRSTVFAR